MKSSWKRDLLGLGLVFLASLAGLCLTLWIAAYTLRTSGGDALWPIAAPTPGTFRIPTLEDVQVFTKTLQLYSRTHTGPLLLAHGALFLFLQTFAIPGTVFCNLAAGALFGMWVGFPLCLVYNTIGAACLYALSRRFGRRLVRRFFPKRLDEFESLLREHAWEPQQQKQPDSPAERAEKRRLCGLLSEGDANLLIYMVVNVSSAQLGIPMRVFLPSMFLGLAPYNFLAVKAGLVLSELTSRGDIVNTTNTLQLAAVAVLGVLIPTVGRRVAGKRKKVV